VNEFLHNTPFLILVCVAGSARDSTETTIQNVRRLLIDLYEKNEKATTIQDVSQKMKKLVDLGFLSVKVGLNSYVPTEKGRKLVEKNIHRIPPLKR
jgi:hypothetical protein